MKQVMLLIAILACFTLKAQDSKQQKKVLIGFNFSPDYSYRTLKLSDGNSPVNVVIDVRNQIEKAKFGYTTGLNVSVNVNDCVALETGVQFANKGYQTKDRELVYADPPAPSDPTQASLRYSYHYIGIPMRVKFSLGKGKARFVSSAGFTTNFLLNASQTAHLKYADGKTKKNKQSSTADFKRMDVSPMVSVGLHYKLNNNIHVTAEPTFRYGLLKIMDAPVAEHLWSAGLNLAIYHNIKGKNK